jgi:cell surface protein SprA
LISALRDDATANSKLDQNAAFGTAGQKVININPTIDYVVNSRIRATLFFQQTRTIPKIATTAPITNTRAGSADDDFVGTINQDFWRLKWIKRKYRMTL